MMNLLTTALGPVANLAGSWLQGKADKNAAAAQLKLVEAESKAKILLSKETSTADWERIMAEGTQSSIKDEVVTFAVLIPVILCFIPGMEELVSRGFQQLEQMPQWYQYSLGTIVAASFGTRAATKFFGKK